MSRKKDSESPTANQRRYLQSQGYKDPEDMHLSPYEIRVIEGREAPVIQLAGEIDYAASLELINKISEVSTETCSELQFDLTKVTLLDSEGIKVLLQTFDQMRSKNGKARIVNASEQAKRVVKLAGIEQILNL